MEFFYDGQIRRYILQVIRVFSNFVVKYGDGSLHQVPVMYGDADRQVASILRNNSENKVNSIPRISVYISGLELDKDRLADQTNVDKVNIRERDMQLDNTPGSPTYGQMVYNQSRGKNYTIERLMPTPFKITMKVDIWSANTEQKLQILEQILVLFNPSLELQTNSNYLDWSSLTVLNLGQVNWSSRTVPVGNQAGGDPIEVATLTVDTPAWINPPAKVKHLGVITKIITSMYNNYSSAGDYIEGLGHDPLAGTKVMEELLTSSATTATNFRIEVTSNTSSSTVVLLADGGTVYPPEPTIDPAPVYLGTAINWNIVLSNLPGNYVAGSSLIYITQTTGSQIIGTFAVDPLNSSNLNVHWNPATLITNTGIDSAGILENIAGYNPGSSYRANSTGTFDAIINPLTYNPKRPNIALQTDQSIDIGTRFLLVEDTGNADNTVPGTAWGSLVAKANDIIEYTGSQWNVIFNSSQFTNTMIWQTNIYTGVQYLWNGVTWVKSYDGEYNIGQWNIIL